MTDINIDKSFLTQTLVDLVQIDSCNPSLTPGAPGERQIGEYVAKSLKSLGLEVHIQKITSGRDNIVGILPGSSSGKSLMWNAHLDTVGTSGMKDPFSGATKNGRLYGRGSQDMKGGLAAMIAAVKSLADANIKLSGDLMIAGVADEEYTSAGTIELLKTFTADAAIVTEPTDLQLGRAHRGFIWFDIETFGHAAHGSRYDVGIDAIMMMGRFLSELEKLEIDLRKRPPHTLVGPPSLHASLIQGGSEVSIYPAHCKLQVEWRTSPGETLSGTTAELQDIADHLSLADPTFKATISPTIERKPYIIDANSSIVQAADKAIAGRLGAAPDHIGVPFWTDAALLADAGIETVLLGPVGAGMHSAEEWVDLKSSGFSQYPYRHGH